MVKGLVIALFAGVSGFVAGSWWHASFEREPPQGAVVVPIAHLCECPPCAAPAQTAVQVVPADAGSAAETPACAPLATALAVSRDEATALRAELRRREKQRVAREGTPLQPGTRPREPRHQPEAQRAAVIEAFQQAKVPGRVDGLDCSEWPCIVYGRIRGTEDEMEKLEGARALAAYENDVLNVVLWVVTDEAATGAPLPILPGRPEQMLFAFAWYPRGLERTLADNVERRVRSRTAELWNTMSPSDETGR